MELPKGGCLVIDDSVRDVPRARVFDPLRHSFNPLKNLDYRRTCDFLDVIDAVFSRGESTLTKDTGLDFLADALDKKPDLIAEPDRKASTGHVWAYGKMRRLLRSPVLTRVLCNPTDFSFNPRSVILARLDRAELGEFDSLVLGLFLVAQFEGQIVVPDFGFYGRDTHSALIRENRLIAGVNFLDELPPRLRQLARLMETVPQGTTFDDAEELAHQAGHVRDTIRFNEFVEAACAGGGVSQRRGQPGRPVHPALPAGRLPAARLRRTERDQQVKPDPPERRHWPRKEGEEWT